MVVNQQNNRQKSATVSSKVTYNWIALGKKYTNTTEGGEENSFRELFQNIAQLIGYFSFSDYIPWLYWIDSLSGLKKRVEKAANEIDAFLEGVIRDHSIALSTGASSDDLLNTLLEIQKQDTNSAFSIDNDSIKGVILNMYFDGTDSTSAVLEWTMAALIKHPDIMCKLKDERFENLDMDSETGMTVHKKSPLVVIATPCI
ncbi:hypothetical protein POM88_048200 [Heracleum sosnowskyi]|uniref:Cytochrome P450 n=1 Tax=Heracleum sosnowskyi TaxID=360622 RepID=A0AAD8GVB5_9APIA|nr:hypothetical protein POM88_048200 [Heracleum sosnowskyi]